MNKLIIITGVSGTGKSSIAKSLYKQIDNSTLLSLDGLIEINNDIMGFKDEIQKKSLRNIAKKMYKKLVEEACRRKDEVIILEYPFKKKWLKFFLKLISTYEYDVYTINMFAKDFDTIWKRLNVRENSKIRHPSHYLSSYDVRKKETYVPQFEYKYKKHKKEYEDLISNSINLGKVINIEDIETVDIKDLVNKIMN